MPRAVVAAWSISLLLILATPLLSLASFGSLVEVPAGVFTLVFFLSTSAVFARRLKISPFTALLALIPFIGVLVVAAVLLKGMVVVKRIDAS